MPFIPVGTFSAYTNIVPSGFGYICGGNSSSIYKILKLNFNSEVLTTSGSTLVQSGFGDLLSGVSNNNVAGYVARGRDNTSLNAHKINFSNDAVSTTGNILSAAGYGRASIQNHAVAGYFSGGTSGSSSSVDKLSFSTDTGSVSTSMPYGNYYIKGVSNSGVAGYINRGNDHPLNKLNFSNDTFTSVTLSTIAFLSTAKYHMGTCENTGIAGYFAGGDSGGSYYNNILKLSFTSDTTLQIANVLSNYLGSYASVSHSQYAGYFTGGTNTSSITGAVNVINKLSFNSDTTSVISATLPSADYNATGLSNGGIV